MEDGKRGRGEPKGPCALVWVARGHYAEGVASQASGTAPLARPLLLRDHAPTPASCTRRASQQLLLYPAASPASPTLIGPGLGPRA